MTSVVGLSTLELKETIAHLGIPAYRGAQVAEWVYRRTLPNLGGGANSAFDTMTDLPKALRQRLAESFSINSVELVTKQIDSRDGTIKIVVRTHDNLEVEAVLMPDTRRVSVCLSSQAGCPMACTFCATGTQGLARNLTAGEIIGQFLILQSLSERAITHVVFMGQGEPLLNVPELVKSISLLHDEIGLSMRHITVSTVGIITGIEKLAELDIPINLAISLHAPNDELRRQIVPKHKSLAELIDTAAAYFKTTGREITFEYILLKNVNDASEHARELARLLRRFPSCTVNLIPYNPTSVTRVFERPEQSTVREFRNILEISHIRTTQRKERGQEIAAACGQLVTQKYDRPGKAMALLLPMSDSETIGEGVRV
jgi:23S rRNA (adenine2503-C2)-methyltransferase